MFILPKRAIKEVSKVLRNFLWSGVEMKSSGAEVSWEEVCLPKDEGLGIKDIGVWNKASVAKHI